MNFKPMVEEDSLWKMFINMEDYENKMVSTRIGWYHIEGYQSRMVSQKEEILLTWKVTRMK
jgi:hypothetical protein